MFYPAKFEKDGDHGYVVTFRDIPEALTQGDTVEESTDMAQDALISAMDFYFEDRRAVPAPSPAKRGEHLIELPPSVAAKVLLLNELVASKLSNAELARRMGTRAQEVQRIVDLGHATKIDTIAAALKAMGKRLDFSVS